MARLLGAVVSACLLVLTVTGCGGGSSDPVAGPSSPGTTAASDEPSTPDDELTDADLRALLRTRASESASGACGPGDVVVTLQGFDVALGHRFTAITVRNTSGRSCVVEGTPGIGVRGEWGRTFVPEVGPGTTDDAAEPVVLAPGAKATSQLEWTGALAGAESEHASLVVVQLARGQVPVAVPARLAGDPPDAPPLDIGELTTLKLTPFAVG